MSGCGNTDGAPEDTTVCPYDSNHRPRNKRMQIHLMHCRRNNPAKAKQMQRCPFNAKHEIPRVEMNYHKTVCPDRMYVEREILHETVEKQSLGYHTSSAPIINHHIATDENWELDFEEPMDDFVMTFKPFRQKGLSEYRQPHGDPLILQQATIRQPKEKDTVVPLAEAPGAENVENGPVLKLPGVGRGQIRSLSNEPTTLVVPGRPSIRSATNSTAFSASMLTKGENRKTGVQTTPESNETEMRVLQKEERKLRKKLKEIIKLEAEEKAGKELNADQRKKLDGRSTIESQLQQLKASAVAVGMQLPSSDLL